MQGQQGKCTKRKTSRKICYKACGYIMNEIHFIKNVWFSQHVIYILFFYVLSFDSKVLIPFSSILFPFFSPRNLSLKCKFNQRTQCMWSKLIKHTIFVGETIWGENVFSCKLLNKTCYFHRSTKTHINMEKLLPASKI